MLGTQRTPAHPHLVYAAPRFYRASADLGGGLIYGVPAPAPVWVEDYLVDVFVEDCDEPIARCLVTELRDCVAGLPWTHTRRVPDEPTLLDLLGWRP